MSARDRDPERPRSPTRIPGEGRIGLERTSGDLQLSGPSFVDALTPWTTAGDQVPTDRAAGARVATKQQRASVYAPSDVVPVSGVYDVVDGEGTYLRHQITCHAGKEFPPTRDHVVAGRDYGYRLAYEAAHLARTPEEGTPADRTIHQPGAPVPVSGVYGVVDRAGRPLRHQKACVRGDELPSIERVDPAGFGYVLDYEARHLSAE